MGFLCCPPDELLPGSLVLTCDCEVYSAEHSLHALQLLNQIAEMGQDLLVRGGRGGLTTLICLASCNSSDSECAPSPAAHNPFLPSSCMQACVAHMAMCVFQQDASKAQECRRRRTRTVYRADLCPAVAPALLLWPPYVLRALHNQHRLIQV